MADVIISESCSEGGTVEIEIDGAPISDSNPMPVDVVAGSISIDPGDIEIGAVEIKSATNDNRAEVDLPANITSADLALAVHDSSLPALGQAAMAASIPVAIASNQSALTVGGAAADGAAVSGNPVRVAGKDGSGNTQDVLTDTAGNQLVAGAGAAGAATTGNPVLVAGTDATNARTLLTDTSGRTVVAGAAADGAAVAGNPVRVAAKDGSGNTQDLQSDTSGTLNVGGTVANLATATGNPVPVGGTNNTVAPTVANGQRNELQVDTSANLMATLATQIAGEDIPNAVLGIADKPLAVTGYSWSVFHDASSATAFSLKASPGCLRSVRVTNANAAVRYMQIHNKASAPAAAESAFDYFLIPAGTALAPAVFELTDEIIGAIGDFLSTGVALAVSTTAATYTAATAADHQLTARYK